MNILDYLNNSFKIKNNNIYLNNKLIKLSFKIYKKNKVAAKYIEEINSVLFVEKHLKIFGVKKIYLITKNAVSYDYFANKWVESNEDFIIPQSENCIAEFNKLLSSSKRFDVKFDAIIEMKNYYDKSFFNQKIKNIGFPVVVLPAVSKKDLKIDDSFSNQISDIDMQYINKINKNYISFCNFVPVQDDYAFRFYIYNEENFYEIFRIIIKNNNFYYYQNIENKFIEIKVDNYNYFTQFYVQDIYDLLNKLNIIDCIHIDDKIFTDTKIKYFNEIIKDVSPIEKIKQILLLSKYPVLEQIYKIGLKKHYNLIVNDEPYIYQIEDHFGQLYNLQEKINKNIKLKDLIKLNSYQFNIIKNYIENNDNADLNIIGYFNIIKPEGFKSIDNKTFDIYFILIKNIIKLVSKESCLNIKTILKTVNELNGIFSLNMTYQIIKKIIQYNKNPEFVFMSYLDTIRMLKEIDQINDFDLLVYKKEDIDNLHNDVLALYKPLENEALSIKFSEQNINGKIYEFEDEKFKIILPKDYSDLINEGNKLHHCVAAYARQVANGFTHILFIRKINDLNTPFFTAEISHNAVIQIRGLCNCNIKDAELESFIEKWKKEKKLN